MSLGYKPKHKARKCRVTEEYGGAFIGRKYCSVHDVHWDGGGDCPQREHRG